MDSPIQRKTYIVQRGGFVQYAQMALTAAQLAQAVITAAEHGISFREATDEEIAALEAVVVIDSFRLKIDPYMDAPVCAEVDWREFDRPPLPRPLPKRYDLRIKQAPKQSFRQSMRSVNRNR